MHPQKGFGDAFASICRATKRTQQKRTLGDNVDLLLLCGLECRN